MDERRTVLDDYGISFSGPVDGPFVAQGPDGSILERDNMVGLRLAVEAYWVPADEIK